VAPADMPPYVREGWLAEGSDADRLRLEHHAIDVLARLHRLTPDSADLSFLDRRALAAEPVDQYLVATRRHYEWAREGVHYPLVERALDWLDAHRPAPGPTVCNWGDARIGNILWRDFAPVAVLDWEMAALGPAEVDLAWMLWLHRFFQDLTERMGAPGLPGMFDRARSLAAYESASGQRVRDLEWFDVLSATRHAVITVRTTMRSVAFGAPPPATPDAAIHFRHLLAAMLDGTYWDRA
jgi:aminoglycoside phosphotransferase (APT) family kinase protein